MAKDPTPLHIDVDYRSPFDRDNKRIRLRRPPGGPGCIPRLIALVLGTYQIIVALILIAVVVLFAAGVIR